MDQLGPFRKHLGQFGTIEDNLEPQHTQNELKWKRDMSVFFWTVIFQKKKTPAAELRNHLGFHKEPMVDITNQA